MVWKKLGGKARRVDANAVALELIDCYISEWGRWSTSLVLENATMIERTKRLNTTTWRHIRSILYFGSIINIFML